MASQTFITFHRVIEHENGDLGVMQDADGNVTLTLTITANEVGVFTFTADEWKRLVDDMAMMRWYARPLDES